MAYAEHTKVPVSRTKIEIEHTVTRYGATAFGTFSEKDRAVIVFAAASRRVRFDLPLPQMKSAEATEREHRRRWRALLLCLKAKLESVESRIETFEEAFLSHIVLPDNTTVGDNISPAIDEAYKSGRIPPLLPGPRP
jgi:hypothetical protein